MKLLIADLDQNFDKCQEFSNSASKILEIETEIFPIYNLKSVKSYPYEKFVKAGFSLETLLLNNLSNFYQQEKPFYNIIYVWGDYSLDNISALKIYQNIFLKDLIVFPTGSFKQNFSWVFGNVIAMTKWSTSLHKINNDLVRTTPRDLYGFTNLDMLPLMWYPIRIGLDVRSIK